MASYCFKLSNSFLIFLEVTQETRKWRYSKYINKNALLIVLLLVWCKTIDVNDYLLEINQKTITFVRHRMGVCCLEKIIASFPFPNLFFLVNLRLYEFRNWIPPFQSSLEIDSVFFFLQGGKGISFIPKILCGNFDENNRFKGPSFGTSRVFFFIFLYALAYSYGLLTFLCMLRMREDTFLLIIGQIIQI